MPLNLSRHELVKFQLRQRHSSLAHIAREIGVSAGTVTAVSQGYRRSRRVELALAAALGMTPEDLYPERNLRKEMSK